MQLPFVEPRDGIPLVLEPRVNIPFEL
jgi:hypothetical protein